MWENEQRVFTKIKHYRGFLGFVEETLMDGYT
jgi:hypothetical protein